MPPSNGSVPSASVPAGCGTMESAESHMPATQADLRCHYDGLQRLLRKLTSEVLAEQRRQLEQSLDVMVYIVAKGGNDASMPDVVPVENIPFRTQAHSATGSPTPPELDMNRTLSQQTRDPWNRHERQDACPHQTSEQEGERSTTPVGIADSAIEGRQSTATTGTRSARFIANDIEQTVSVEARLSRERNSDRTERSLSWASQSTQLLNEFDKSCAKRITSPAFDVFCGIIICMNAILVGIETECLAQDGRVPNSIELLQLFLNTWYMLELLLRLYGYKLGFFVGDERNWNLFDMILVTSAVVDLFLANNSVQNFKTARILRAVRLFRIVRTLRILRAFKYVREFRKMVYSLISSMQTLFWSLLLVFGVMYSFALWFTQAAATYKAEQAPTDDSAIMATLHALNTYYSSCSRTAYTLFASIAGGYSWHIAVDPWISAGDWLSSLMFFVYISMVVFGLMNIVTSVFVESAMHATKHFQDLLVDAQKKDLEMFTFHMKRIFREIDKDNGGTISYNEMQLILHDGQSELSQYLEALGISSGDVWVLFRLLDKDGSGSIDAEEFCHGCMRLKGEARSFDINCMIYESRAMIKNHAKFMEFVEETLQQIGSQLEQFNPGKCGSFGYCAMLPRLEPLVAPPLRKRKRRWGCEALSSSSTSFLT